MVLNKYFSVVLLSFFLASGAYAGKKKECEEIVINSGLPEITTAVEQGDNIRFVEDESEIPHIADIAARAFDNDPLFLFVSKNPAKRRQFLETLIRQAFIDGKIIVNADTEVPLGFALWMRSKDASAGFIDMFYNGQMKYVFTSNPIRTVQLLMLDNYFIKTRKKVTGSDDSLYLYVVGVEPDYQGQGIGSRLIKPVLSAAAETKRPIVLETQKESNVGYYERLGFKVSQRGGTIGGAPETITMVWFPPTIP